MILFPGIPRASMHNNKQPSSQNSLNIVPMMSLIKRLLLSLLLSVYATVLTAQSGVDSGWYADTEVELVSPQLAEARLVQEMAARKAEMGEERYLQSLSQATSVTEITPEIQELARGLQHDPLRIYNHVKNHIDYLPYFGYLKGPTLTWLDREGNDFDQASLLIALLRASGYSAKYAFGTMTMPSKGGYQNNDLAHWFGVEEDNNRVIRVLAVGGIPASFIGDTFEVRRVWVEAVIEGKTVQLDPAFKVYDYVEGIDLNQVAPVSHSDLSAIAGGSTQSSGDSVSSLNASNISTQLTQYTTQFIEAIRTHHPNKSLDEVLGGYQIRPKEVQTLPNYPAFSFVRDALWGDVPPQYTHTVRVVLAGLDKTLNIPDIAGKKLSVSFQNTGNTVNASTISANNTETTPLFDVSTVNTDEIYHYRSQAKTITEFENNNAISEDTELSASNVIQRYQGQTLRINFEDLFNNDTVNIAVTKTEFFGATARYQVIEGLNPRTVPPGSYVIQGALQYKADEIGTHSITIRTTFTYRGRTYYRDDPITIQTIAFPYAQLSLDDQVIHTEQLAQPGAKLEAMVLVIDHPYSARSGSYADQVSEYPIRRGGNYVILSAFGRSTSGKLLEQRQRQLRRLEETLPSSSNVLLTEALNVSGQSWMLETTMAMQLLRRISRLGEFYHHRFGLMAQEEGFYIDIKDQFGAIYHHTSETTTEDFNGYFRSGYFLASALEHGIIEQLQSVAAASTIQLLAMNNNAGRQTYRVTASNWNTVKTQLVNYSTAQIAAIDDFVSTYNDAEIILPIQGNMRLGAWQGTAYAAYSENPLLRMNMAISGGYGPETAQAQQDVNIQPDMLVASTHSGNRVFHGGFGATREPINTAVLNENSFDVWRENADNSHVTVADPIDFVTGAFLYDLPTLSIGAAEPWGASVLPSYSSINKEVASTLGNGWEHSYDIQVNRYSDHRIGLGSRSVLDAAPSIIASLALLDAMKQPERTAKDWLIGALVADWQMNRLTEQSVSVSFEHKKLAFTQLPDGRYIAPPGSNMTLTGNDGNYRLSGRFGPHLTFDGQNRIQAWKDADGNTLSFDYGGDGVTRVTDAAGRYLTFAYSNNKITSIQDSTGRSIAFGYDSNNNLTRFTDVLGGQWQLNYDTQNQLLSVVNPLNVTKVENRYDALGRVYEQLLPIQDGTTALSQMFYQGVASIEADPTAAQTTYRYDDLNRVIQFEDALGQTAQTGYNGQNLPIYQIDALGNRSANEYDADNNHIASIDALNQRRRYEYDRYHHLEKTIDELGHWTTVYHDSEHHPYNVSIYPCYGAQISRPAGRPSPCTETRPERISTITRYDEAGFPVQVTDGKGISTYMTYDANRYQDEVWTEGRPPVNYDYDMHGNLIKFTDQEGAIYRFTYNAANQLTERTDPFGRKTTHQYDVLGQRLSVTDRNGDTTRFSYTPNNLTETVTYADGSTTNYQYNDRNELVQMADSLGTSRYTYDAIGQLTAYTDAQDFEIQYEYDAVGNITKLIYPDGNAIDYKYDALYRLIEVTNWRSETLLYHYDAASRLIKAEHFNGTVTDYHYDDANRFVSLETMKTDGEIINSQTFALDNNGNRIEELRTQPQQSLELTETVNYTYDDKKQRLVGVDNGIETALSYDFEGQLQQHGQDAYTFNVRHQLSALNRNNIDSSYAYDGSGERLRAIRDGVTTRYIYDASGHLLAEANASGAITRHYIYGLGLAALVQDNQTYTYHFDAIGSTIAITDSDQTLVNQYAYSPYGRNLGRTTTINQPFTYAGQAGIMEEQENLYFAQARYYDADIGRFISEDPLGLEASVNVYGYVDGNPLSYIDPTGLAKQQGALGAVFGNSSPIAGRYQGNFRDHEYSNFPLSSNDHSNFLVHGEGRFNVRTTGCGGACPQPQSYGEALNTLIDVLPAGRIKAIFRDTITYIKGKNKGGPKQNPNKREPRKTNRNGREKSVGFEGEEHNMKPQKSGFKRR